MPSFDGRLRGLTGCCGFLLLASRRSVDCLRSMVVIAYGHPKAHALVISWSSASSSAFTYSGTCGQAVVAETESVDDHHVQTREPFVPR